MFLLVSVFTNLDALFFTGSWAVGSDHGFFEKWELCSFSPEKVFAFSITIFALFHWVYGLL